MSGPISHKLNGYASGNLKSPGSKSTNVSLTGKSPSKSKGKSINHGLVKSSLHSKGVSGMKKIQGRFEFKKI